MLALSIAISYVTVSTLTPHRTEPYEMGYEMGYILGRAFWGTLYPLLIAALVSGIYKLISKKSLPGYFIWLWALWFVLGLMATIGSTLPA